MTNFDPLDHIVRMRKLRQFVTVVVPIIAILAALLALFFHPGAGFFNDYPIWFAVVALAVTYGVLLGAAAIVQSAWNKEAKACHEAHSDQSGQ